MPKKFVGENSKAEMARIRKAEAKAEADAQRKKAEEDAMWEEKDKHVLKKGQRKDDKEKKRTELLERKKENQRLLDEENARLRGKATKEAAAAAAAAAAGGKLTRAQIEEGLLNEQLQEEEGQIKEKSHLETPLEENVNRIDPEEDVEEAKTIEDAISLLSTQPEEVERHPERRMKAAYNAYEEASMPRLKMENPNMRLSQLKQMLKKEWVKSPENPLNQRFASYNTK
ncbi:coiled-coil domain-containing protein 124 [Genypterus blacodes]|uniref:coiled-coil domain-containing protein 124 n=1 Tax=Genypterus blacodes TaxID=154954 RepID=UPI003F762380